MPRAFSVREFPAEHLHLVLAETSQQAAEFFREARPDIPSYRVEREGRTYAHLEPGYSGLSALYWRGSTPPKIG